jgi:DNA-binding transcriptional MocR family regulator
MAAYQPRLYVTNSVLHNPTGSSLSPVIAHKVLKLAEQWDLTIIEDDVYADLEHEPGTRLAAFDGLSRVIHVGSFSKTLTAAARCGYIAVRSDWVEALLDLKVAVTFGASQLAAELILTLLTDGSYHRHIYSLRERLARAMSQTTTKLQSIGFEPYLQPDGGMFLWCRLPHGIDAIDLARKALIENVVLAPGNVFSTSSTASSFMRFNVAQSRDPQLFEVLARLLAEYH